jgi:hypothetical protein
MSYRLTAHLGSSLLLSTCLFGGAIGCQTAEPKPDASNEAVSQVSAEEGAAEADAAADVEASPSKTKGARDDAHSDEPPEAISLTLQVSPKVVTIDGDELLVLEGGYIGQSSFTSRYYFTVKGLVEPVDAALVAERRRRVVYGEEITPGRVLVEVDPSVPADTIMALQYTLAKTDLEWMTLQVGDASPVHLRLTRDFMGGRRVAWSRRKPDLKKYAEKTRGKTSEDQTSDGQTVGGQTVGGKVLGAGPLKNIFGSSESFDSKMNVAMSAEGGEVVVGRGAGGMGLRGTGKGGGGEGFGRIRGLGKVDTGKKSSKKKSDDKATLLGTLGANSVKAKGFGGLGLRGRGRGGGGGAVGVGTVGIGRIGLAARTCAASDDQPPEPMALTHATIKLYPERFDAWLSERHDGYRKHMFEEFAVDLAKVEGVDSYPWWKLYNTLNRMQSYYGEADTLLIWLHPSLSSRFVTAASKLNCKLPESSYDSREAWQEARAGVERCEPIFEVQMLGNGKHPRKN